MLNYFKKSFLLLITAIFLTQSLFIACSTEVDSEVKKIEEEKPSVPTIVKKTHNVTGIPESWAETDVYAYAYNTNGDKILIPVSVKDGVATFEADETYTRCVLVSLPKGIDISAYSANPASILNADCQKSEVIDLTKGSLAFVLAKSDYIGIWNSLEDELILNEDGTFSLDIGNNDSTECKGTYVDTKTGVKATYSEKVEETDVQKNIEFTKIESDVLVGSINEKDTYFVKSTNETPNLNGTWASSNGTTVIINNESKNIYVNDGESEIWGTIVQTNNMIILQDESSNVIGTGFVSAAGNAYIYNEATGTYEIFTRNGSATESNSTIPLKMFTVTYKSEFADDDVQEKEEGTVLELPTPSYKGHRFDGWYTDSEKTKKAEANYTIVENLTFYAKWVQQGTVKFISEHSEHPDKVVDLGTEIDDIPVPTKEKFAFDGWFDGETKVSGKYVVTKDVELVAKWTALYNVTFETAGGSPVESLQNVRAGTVIRLPETTLDGYDFEWWATEGKTYAIDAEYEVNSDVIFVAKWQGICKVVYNTNGGSSVESETVHDMETIHMPAAPTKDGHRFLGWYTTDKNNLMQPGDVFNVTDSVTINAKWIAQYKYSFDNNDGNVYEVAYTVVDDGTEITVEDEISLDGNVFKGWQVGEEIYQPGDKYTITSNVTFTVVWNPIYLYGYEGFEAVLVENGEKVTIQNALEAEGCTFAGWSDGTSVYQPGYEYTISGDVYFTPVWNVTVTYNGVYVECEGKTIEKGTSVILPTPTYDGYTFEHWTSNVSEAWYSAGDKVEISENVTFTAVWTKDPVAYSISGVPTTGWGVVEVYVYNEAEGRENGELLGNNHAVDGEGNIIFETAKDITHCILVSFGDPDPSSEMPSYSDLEDLLNVSSTYSEDLNVTSGKATFVQYVPKVTYTIKNAEGYNTPYVTIDGEEVASVYNSETKTVTFEYAEGLTGCLIAKNDSHSAEKEIIFDENGIGMLNPQFNFVIDPNQVYFRNSKSWHGGIQVYAWHSSDPKNVVRIDMTKAADTDQWYYADVDYSLYDTVYFAGQTTNNAWDNGETCSIILDKSKIFYRPSDDRKDSLGIGADGRDKFDVMNFEKINDYAPGFN